MLCDHTQAMPWWLSSWRACCRHGHSTWPPQRKGTGSNLLVGRTATGVITAPALPTVLQEKIGEGPWEG